MPDSSELYVEYDPPLAWIVFNRPEKHNAFTKRMWRDLPELIKELEVDHTVRVIVFRGAGEASFSVGADIEELKRLYDEDGPETGFLGHTGIAVDAIAECHTPTIAMVHGLCFGGGCAIALCADIRIASEEATFAITPAKLGLGYPFNGVERAVQELGPANARYLLMTAKRVLGEDALQTGLVQELHKKEDLLEATLELAHTVASNAPKTIRAIRKSIQQVLLPPSDRSTKAIHQWIVDCANSDDYQEGLQAFMEKRKPKFRGR